MNQLPVDTICLLPTCYLCTTLNTAMLDKINSDEILLIAEDDVDCAPAMKKKVHKILKDKDEKVAETAGIERVIAIKIGAKVMIRRNIDVTLVVHRKQFPLSLSYGITVHKSQGITCKNAAIVEYNRLRSVFKSPLPQINSSEKKAVKIHDCRWAIPHIIDDVQNYGCAELQSIVTWKIYGLCNDDSVLCYANVTLQCAFHCVRIRQQILKNKVSNALTDAVCAYAERKRCNILAVRRSVGERFEERTQQDVSEFFTALMSTYSEINDVLEVELKHLICCSNAKCNYNVTTLEKSCLLILPMQSTLKRKKGVTLQTLINSEFSKWEL
ncbi:hypothetical protein ALC57_14527 [Trachymyrmex cornetzi]|uniref:ATP-dependent DNA helicase PIF1 n=1 Tax=Trachymyrmex cornetzi TaxID=471704 RepID=A0A151IYA9_9HYME|nr:hypothetical protein ALC57_14527 [Trachymyrmex cornetzi]